MGFCVSETLSHGFRSAWATAIVAAVAPLALCACDFDTSADIPKASDAPGADAGSKPNGSLSGKADAAMSLPVGQADAGARDAGSGGPGGASGDAGDGDSGLPPQNGGLKCGDVFCPFADAPIEPCCTAGTDVEDGLARQVNRCGVSFAETGRDFFGTGCWQRDQPGVVDKSCPGVQVDLHSKDPGCCTDDGKCGGIDTEHGLGCHGEPGTKAKACGEDPAPSGKTCDLSGVYAVRMEVDLAWGGRSGGLWDLTDDGRGKLVLNLLSTIEASDDPKDDRLEGTARVCGVELPAFYSTTVCEAYNATFPDAMWESETMPRFHVEGRSQCRKPGCIATIDAQTVLLGIGLDNPEAPWPTASESRNLKCEAGTGAACFPDDDGDGLPGLTVPIVTEGTSTEGKGCNQKYDNDGAPLNASPAAIFGGVRRTDRLELGVRMKVGLSFKIGKDCESGAGTGIAEFVNSRAYGCLVQKGTYDFGSPPAGADEKCNATQASFMDSNLPLYTILDVDQVPPSNLDVPNKAPSLGPQVSIVRIGDVGDELGCEEVRATPHP
jgi:hypothetical protein